MHAVSTRRWQRPDSNTQVCNCLCCYWHPAYHSDSQGACCFPQKHAADTRYVLLTAACWLLSSVRLSYVYKFLEYRSKIGSGITWVNNVSNCCVHSARLLTFTHLIMICCMAVHASTRQLRVTPCNEGRAYIVWQLCYVLKQESNRDEDKQQSCCTCKVCHFSSF